MGTNYYAKENYCDKCKQFYSVHIGKSSGGWRFGFNRKFKTGKEWFEYLKDKPIFDEYDRDVNFEEFKNIIIKNNSLHHECGKGEFLDAEGFRIIDSDDFC